MHRAPRSFLDCCPACGSVKKGAPRTYRTCPSIGWLNAAQLRKLRELLRRLAREQKTESASVAAKKETRKRKPVTSDFLSIEVSPAPTRFAPAPTRFAPSSSRSSVHVQFVQFASIAGPLQAKKCTLFLVGFIFESSSPLGSFQVVPLRTTCSSVCAWPFL